MTAPSDEKLMRYFDGEVDAAEAREIEAWLAGSAERRSMLVGFERVGDAVRAIGGGRGTGAFLPRRSRRPEGDPTRPDRSKRPSRPAESRVVLFVQGFLRLRSAGRRLRHNGSRGIWSLSVATILPFFLSRPSQVPTEIT